MHLAPGGASAVRAIPAFLPTIAPHPRARLAAKLLSLLALSLLGCAFHVNVGPQTEPDAGEAGAPAEITNDAPVYWSPRDGVEGPPAPRLPHSKDWAPIPLPP